jgi:hypothetical protein
MSEERIVLPKLAIAGNMVVEMDTVGTDSPRFVAKIGMGKHRADFIKNTTIMLEVVKRYNASLRQEGE